MTNLGTPKLWSLLTGCSEVAYIIKLKLGLENGGLCRQVVVKSDLTPGTVACAVILATGTVEIECLRAHVG